MSSVMEKLFAGKRRKVVAAIVVLVVGAGSVWFLRRQSAAVEFITEPVSQGSIRNVVNATGTVQALLTVQVGSQVSGQVEALYADFNSVVKHGQVLAKLDPRNYQAALDGANANLLSAEAKLSSAEADLNSQIASEKSAQANVESARVARDNTAMILKRYDELHDQGILSQNDYDTAKSNADTAAAKYNQAVAQAQQSEAQIKSSQAQVAQAQAAVKQSQAALSQAKINLDYTIISSPVDGVVVSRNVDVGQTVAASLSAPTLFVIANDLSKMQVNASVDEADIGNITDVEDVQFSVDAYPNRTFTGRIAEVRLEPTTVQNVTTYSVIIFVDNEQLELKPGMTANITVTVAKQDNVLRIANAAMRYLPPGMTRDDVTEMLRKAGPQSESAALPEPAPAKAEASPESLANAMPGPSDAGEANARGGFQKGGNGGGMQGNGRQGQAEGGAAWQGNRRQGQAGQAGTGTWQGGGRPAQGAAGARQSAAPQTEVAGLAPGQLWNPAEKIQFPRQRQRSSRPGIVWVLDAQKKPEARQVLLGITDGKSTQVISGDLKDGDQVIVGDSSQAASAQTLQNRNQGQQGGFGGGGFPGGGGGGRGGFLGGRG
jgi:HlyD family secretion protein